MKKLFRLLTALSLLLAITIPAHAQSRKVIYLQSYDQAPYHFGFLLGANFMGYSIKTIDDYQHKVFEGSWLPRPIVNNDPNYFSPGHPGEYELHDYSHDAVDHFVINRVESTYLLNNLGFSVGVIGDLRLANSFNLRFSPTLSLGSREIHYTLKLYDADNHAIIMNNSTDSIHHTRSKDILATYMEFPLHIKYRSHRYNNIAAYLIAGVNPKLFLFSRAKHGSGEQTSNNQPAAEASRGSNDIEPEFLLPKRSDIALEIGAGYDIYNQWFKMGIEIKYSLGMFNLLRNETAYQEYLYQAPIKSLRNKQLQISLTFE